MSRHVDRDHPRILHSPINVAGGPGAIVAGMRKEGCEAELWVFNEHRFAVARDRVLGLRRSGNRAADLVVNVPRQTTALVGALRRFDVFHFHFGVMLAPRRIATPILRAARKPIVHQLWGSEIRDKTPDQVGFLADADAVILSGFDTFTRAPRADWIPEYHVVPYAIELDRWPVVAAPPNDGTLRVVHAPSHRGVKGTEAVITAVANLQARGVRVELDLVEGLHQDEARLHYERADLIVDQLRVGWYGLFATESMAMGKPVICYLEDEPARLTRETFGLDVPLINADEATIEATIERFSRDHSELIAIGRASRAFAEQVHADTAVARRMLDVYRATGVLRGT